MMKKSLIALAIAAAAPVAFAATSNVDVYGAARVSVQKATGGKTTMVDQTSRIGMKGSEDLGGGLSAIYGIEWGVNFNSNNAEATAATSSTTSVVTSLTTATGGNTVSSYTTGTVSSTTTLSNSPFGARNAFVGLKGAFGTVLMGKHDTPYKMAGSADLFADTAADATDGTAIIGYGNFDLRVTNALAYISPDYAGFHAAVAITNNSIGSTTATVAGSAGALDDSHSLALVYVNGPLKATYGYEKHGAQSIGKVAGGNTEKANKFNVSYKLGDATVGYTHESQKRDDLTVGDAKNQLLSASYTMGPIVLAAQTGKRDSDLAINDLKRTTMGVVYSLSKRTNAAVIFNRDNANGTKTTTNGLQLNHSF
jgi:predicted porin